MKNKIRKGIGIATGLVELFGTFFLIPKLLAKNNPADITADYRQIPVPAAKICYDTKREKWACGSFPFGKNKDYSSGIFGWTDGNYNTKMLMGIAAAKKGNLDLGLQATKIWTENGNFPTEFTASADLNNNHGGLATLVNLNNPEKSQGGARLNVKDLTLYFKSSLNDLKPVLGISYEDNFTVDVGYDTQTKTGYLRGSKPVNTKLGTFIPELRATRNNDDSGIGLGLLFIPK